MRGLGKGICKERAFITICDVVQNSSQRVYENATEKRRLFSIVASSCNRFAWGECQSGFSSVLGIVGIGHAENAHLARLPS